MKPCQRSVRTSSSYYSTENKEYRIQEQVFRYLDLLLNYVLQHGKAVAVQSLFEDSQGEFLLPEQKYDTKRFWFFFNALLLEIVQKAYEA